MKKLFTLLAFITTIAISAQAPQGFSYQATVRNSSGDLIANQNVYFKFNVMLNSSTSVPVFSETHYVPTDDLGQVNLTIGQGTATTGTFSTINWGTGNYYLGIELNTGNGYVAMGTTQLLSVPYALYANSSGNSQAATPNLATVLAVGSDANNTNISNLTDPVDSQDAATKGYVDSQLEKEITDLQSQITALQNAIDNSLLNTIPAPPINLIGFVDRLKSIDAIILDWKDQSTNETGFKIERRVTGTANYAVIGTVGANILTYRDEALTINTSYDYRVYSYNAVGNSSSPSNELTLVLGTLTTLPTLTTTTPNSINTTTVSSGGDISSDGGAAVTERGVVWSTSTNPTFSIATKTTDGIGTGTFSSAISGLLEGTTYYVRAYATNDQGTAYGNELSFTTLSSTTAIPSRVTIGNQVWTTKNLEVTTYSDGTPIPEVTDPKAWAALTTGAWCYYGNDSANGTTYGKLYNWYAVAGIHDNDPNTANKILAPTGWHVPSDAEYATMINFLGGDTVAGGKMKETSTTHWVSPNTSADNSSGFSGLPGGYCDANGSFIDIGNYGSWWSTSETSGFSDKSWSFGLHYGNGKSKSFEDYKIFGNSVRCVKD